MTVREVDPKPSATTPSASHPLIIQGGMGVGVSHWHLARTVSQLGQLGVVSGTAAAVLLARRLQLGDPGGHMRRGLQRFPVPGVADRILDHYFIPGGKPADKPFKLTPTPSLHPSRASNELTVAANFVEVFLAKEGHSGVVGVNYLEKLQIPTLPSLFGAMLAGVDYVLIGAGVPRSIPGCLDQLARGEPAHLRIDVIGASPGEEVAITFDPADFCGGQAPALKRPQFLAIVSSATLATALARKSNGKVNGFIVEGSRAGGHNAPPRGPMRLNERGEPLYGQADVADLEKIRSLGLPFWLAGEYAEPARLAQALAAGAAGVQVGTAFAFCDESGIDESLKRQVVQRALSTGVSVKTDPVASPTGFPFKVAEIEGTLSDEPVYVARERLCDLGFLRSSYRRADGTIGHRCPAEPEAQYVAKGGDPADVPGRKCLCNGLLSTVGLGQALPGGGVEPPIVTAGDDVANLARLVARPGQSYTAADVVRFILGSPTVAAG